MEISKVHPRLFVAGDPVYSPDLAADLATIDEHVDLILDLRSDDGENSDDGWHEVCLHKLHAQHPMNDDGRRKNSYTDFVDVLDVLEDAASALDIPVEELGVLVHCHMGVNRSPSMALFLLAALHDVAPIDGLSQIAKARPPVGMAYAELAVEAWCALYEGAEDLTHVKNSFGYEFEAWQTRAQQLRTNKYISICNRKYRKSLVVTDSKGNMHGTRR